MFDSISSLLRSREAAPSLILSRDSAFLRPWFLFLYTPWCWDASLVFWLSWSSDNFTALNVAIEFWLWFRSNTYISTNFIFIRMELRFMVSKIRFTYQFKYLYLRGFPRQRLIEALTQKVFKLLSFCSFGFCILISFRALYRINMYNLRIGKYDNDILK